MLLDTGLSSLLCQIAISLGSIHILNTEGASNISNNEAETALLSIPYLVFFHLFSLNGWIWEHLSLKRNDIQIKNTAHAWFKHCYSNSSSSHPSEFWRATVLWWCGAVRSSAVMSLMWCGVGAMVWCGVVWCGAVRCDAMRWSVVRCGVLLCFLSEVSWRFSK